MAPLDRRQRERLAMRAKIFDAARDLFAEHGFEAVTMRKIAEKIEYTPTAIYFHFADKESLVRELCAEDFREFGRRIASISSEKDIVRRMRRGARAYLDFALAYPNHYRLMFMTPLTTDPDMTTKGDPQLDAYAFLLLNIQEARAKGLIKPAFKDDELVAQLVWSCIHGLVSLELVKGDHKWIPWRPLPKRFDTLLDVMLDSFLVQPAKAKPSKRRHG